MKLLQANKVSVQSSMGRVVWAYYQLGFSNKFLRSKRRCAVCMCWGKVGLVPWWASTSEMAQLNASHSSSLLSPEHQAARHFPCSQQRLTLCPCQCPDHLNIPLRDILHSQHIHISLTHSCMRGIMQSRISISDTAQHELMLEHDCTLNLEEPG